MEKILTTILYFIVFTSFGQQNQVEIVGDNLSVNLFNDNNSKVTGSPYVDEEFQLGRFHHNNKTYLVRYNAHREIMQVKFQKNQIMNLSPLDNYKITVLGGEKTYIVTKYPDGVKGFGVLLWFNTKGQRLIKRETIKMNAAKEEKAYQSATPASFTKLNESYYFEDKNKNTITQLSKNKNKLFEEIFDADFKTRAKKEKLNTKSEADLVKLFKSYFGNGEQ